MKYLFNNLNEVRKITKLFNGYVMMFDFDGTLSPIAPTPNQACLPLKIKVKLKECAKLFPVVIISGRGLNDVKNKVGLKNLIYAGNHGLEWQIGKRIYFAPGAKKAAKLFKIIKLKLKKICQAYPGVLLEDKRLTMSIHYRLLSLKAITKFKKELFKIIGLFNGKNDLQIFKGKKVIELKPNTNWHKGKFALFIYRYFKKKLGLKLFPVYVGDDITDEDVFAALRFGATIRVGKKGASRAKYFVNNTQQIVLFINRLLASH